MTDAARALEALGDPTRRAVLDVLRGGEHSVGALTESVAVTQSAVSQHLRVLREAGLVTERREGTRRLYRVDADGLAAVRAYLDGVWDAALATYARAVTDEDKGSR